MICNILPWDFRAPVLRVIVPPVVEPLSLAEAKSQVHVDDDMDADDADLERAITAAREYCEGRKCASFVEQTLEYALPYFPPSGWAIQLPRATSLQSISSVTYRDSDGVSTTWDAANYEADASDYLGLLVPAAGVDYPTFTAWPVNAVRIRFVAGESVASPALPYPSSVVLAMKQLVGHWYRNREATVVGFQHAEEMALMVDSLLGVGQRIF